VDTSEKVLLVGGVVSLTYGFLLGLPLTMARMKAPTASRHLVTAHLAAIIQGATLVALSEMIAHSELPTAIETTAAVLLVGCAGLFVAGAVANWRQAVEDHFAERSLGWKLLASSGPANVAGIVIILIGTLRGL